MLLTPSPLSQAFRTPLERDVLYGRPHWLLRAPGILSTVVKSNCVVKNVQLLLCQLTD